jgi:hypothetical protein
MVNPGDEEVLGMESPIYISFDRASIKWCRENHFASQPLRSRQDRWVTSDAMVAGGDLAMTSGKTVRKC